MKNRMIPIPVSGRIKVFITLIILTALTGQHVHGKVIMINTTGGSDNKTCCVDGECVCTSLSTALLQMTSYTVINITSESVALEGDINLTNNLRNITLTGNGATVMCNSKGAINCYGCSDVLINGITWDKCIVREFAGFQCDHCHNIKLVKCAFQYSSIAVGFSEVTGNIVFNSCQFSYNDHCGLRIVNEYSGSYGYTLVISGSTFDSNNGSAFHLDTNSHNGLYSTSLLIEETNFTSNIRAIQLSVITHISHSIELTQVIVSGSGGGLDQSYISGISLVSHSNVGTTSVVVSSALFENNAGIALSLNSTANMTTILLFNSSFVNNTPIINYYESSGIVLIKPGDWGKYVRVNFSGVYFSNNSYKGENGGTVYILNTNKQYNFLFSNCIFQNNTSPGDGTALYIDNSRAVSNDYYSSLMIFNSVFKDNVAGDSIIYVKEGIIVLQNLTLSSVLFVNNVGSCLYLPKCNLHLVGSVYFSRNTASNAAALYCYHGTNINITEGANVTFIENKAWEYGGAIYVDVDPVLCQSGFSHLQGNTTVLFQENIARYSGDSIYFHIPDSCSTVTNISYEFVCQFNYTQSSHLSHLPCTGHFTQDSPVVTSPYTLSLYLLHASNGVNETYIPNNALGIPVIFSGTVYDYFGTPCERKIFDLQCMDCPDDVELVYPYVVVDNTSPLSMTFVGSKVNDTGINVTVVMSALLVPTTLVVELLPCEHHPGNVYDNTTMGCICFHSNHVTCYEDYNEIKRGFWVGSVSKTPTTSLCPNRYCKFHDSTAKEGYCVLPDSVDAQCNHHRTGVACGECSPGYTLAYDSTDCISVDHCSAGMTVLVVVSTCLYWIVVVVGVFSAMYLSAQVSLGYFYGIIYFYSMVVILLHDNPYMSDNAFHFVSVLSSFAQLSPQFLGELCFIRGLSGIDQVFIHYFHAAAVSLLVLGIVVAAKWSTRITRFIGRCIIRVICLLLLLSYTSIASTSLQLLQALKFTGIDETYTNLSPRIKYFHDRHAFYGSVAAVLELVIVIGLPLILLLEPFVSSRINFIKIKPLLDQFQSPYKAKYRWFAAYYLICRQAIVLAVCTSNDSYNPPLLYVNIAIVVIHLWIQPYKTLFLNAMDSLILLFMVLVVVAPLLPSSVNAVTLVFILFPLLFVCINGIVKMIFWILQKRRPHHQYVAINDEHDDDNRRNLEPVEQFSSAESQSYSTFQESLLEYSSVNN